jgi:hypothetical protein
VHVLTFRRWVVHRRVIVNTKTDKAFSGVVTRKSGPLIELRDAELLQSGRPPVKIDGAVIIERSNLDFVQIIEG